MYFRNKVIITNFIFAVLVLFLHSYNIDQYSELGQTYLAGLEGFISQTLGNLAVPGFFLISAFLFFRDYSCHKIGEKYKSRVRSVLLPYLIWNLLYYFVFLFLVRFPASRYFMETQQVEISWSELLQAVFDYKYNGVYWYMQQLIFYIILSPIIWVVTRKCGIAVTVICFLFSLKKTNIVLGYADVRLDTMVYWCLGCYFGTHKLLLFEKRIGIKYRKLCVALFCVLLAVRYVIGLGGRELLQGTGTGIITAECADVLVFAGLF